MKITDEFEWSCLKDFAVLPNINVNAVPNKKCLSPERTEVEDSIIDSCNSSGVPNLIETTVVSNVGSSRWVIPGADRHLGVEDEDNALMDFEDIDRGQLTTGSIFDSKDRMVSAVGKYHMQNFFDCITKHSDTRRYHVVCKSELTCVVSLRGRSSKAEADYFGLYMNEDGFNIRPRDIQSQLLRDFGVNIKYPTALAGRNLALKQIHGDHIKPFQMLSKYLYMLEQLNPGSIVDIQTLDDDTFQYCYFSLGACRSAFQLCCPVIVIDATHLKGKYKSVLFVASKKYSNEQIVPLAYGIGDKENDQSWTWFIQQVQTSFGCPDNLLFVSYQHLSIKNIIRTVYQETPHRLCTYHIQGKLRCWGESVIDMFHLAANAYKEKDFNDNMSNLLVVAPGAHAKLMNIDPRRWALCKCLVRLYAFVTSNAVEVLNSRLKWARRLPICSLLESARNLVQSWFYKRMIKTRDIILELSVYADKRVRYVMKKGSTMRVEPISDSKFDVIQGVKKNFVNITLR